MLKHYPPHLGLNAFWSRRGKTEVPSRAYIHFISAEALADFVKGYQGHIFEDAKGGLHFRPVHTASQLT